MTDTCDDDFVPPYIYLESCLDTYEDDHENWYQLPATVDEQALHSALSSLARHALSVLRTGRVPEELHSLLESYEPWRPLEERVAELMFYNYLLRRIEFGVAWEAVSRLAKSDERIMISVVAMLNLRKATLSITAGKYLAEVSELYMAGWHAAVFVMAGAVLEAAMRDRLPDEELLSAGEMPKHVKTGVFSIGQRMKLERRRGILTEKERERFWKVINWRNDVLHVQPDVAPDPGLAVFEVAALLARILPRDDSAAAGTA